MTETTNHLTESEAREIAAQWQSVFPGGIGFAMFASTGAVTDDLLDDLECMISQLECRDPALGIYVTDDGLGGWVDGDLGSVETNLAALRALHAYIMPRVVTVWSVGASQPGCLLDTPATWHLDYEDALDAFVDMIREAPDAWYPEQDDETDEEYESLKAHVAAYIADEVHRRPAGQHEHEITLRPGWLAVPTVFWISKIKTTVAAYLAETEA